jgi:hypothetical protein
MFFCDRYKWREGRLKISGEKAISLIAKELPFYAYIIVFETGSKTQFYYKEREKIIEGTEHLSLGIPDNPGGYTYRLGGKFKNIEDYAEKAIEKWFFSTPKIQLL